jgi:hypothetical protein
MFNIPVNVVPLIRMLSEERKRLWKADQIQENNKGTLAMHYLT